MTKSITYEVTVSECNTFWRLNGKFHREDGPAIEYADGDKYWFINGKYHREDGPAVEHANGTKAWCTNGEYHRTDGPAIEYADGTNQWYIDGEVLSEDEFIERTQPVVEVTVAEIEALVGKRVKIIK